MERKFLQKTETVQLGMALSGEAFRIWAILALAVLDEFDRRLPGGSLMIVAFAHVRRRANLPVNSTEFAQYNLSKWSHRKLRQALVAISSTCHRLSELRMHSRLEAVGSMIDRAIAISSERWG